jgi:hypothetical protein
VKLEPRYRHRPLTWGLAALALGTLIQFAQANTLGGWSGLLAVGSESPTRFVIQQQLPDLVLVPGDGHDGQTTYAMALDPAGRTMPGAIPEAGYRYRRILLPAIAGAFGAIDGSLLLYSLSSLTAVGFAVAVTLVARIAQDRSLPWATPLAVLLNVGLWLSMQITTPDTLAFAMGLAGVVLYLRSRHILAAIALALAALAKETFVLIAIGLAIHRVWTTRRLRSAVPYAASVMPMSLWWTYVALRVPGGTSTGGNLTWPFAGIVEASSQWASGSVRDLVFLGLTAAALCLSLVVLARRGLTLWACLIVPWLALAAVSSHWIWDLGNNAVRAFLPLITFGLLGWLDVDRKSEISAVRRGQLLIEPST